VESETIALLLILNEFTRVKQSLLLVGFEQQLNKSASIPRSLKFVCHAGGYGQVQFRLSFPPSRCPQLQIFQRVGIILKAGRGDFVGVRERWKR
jgi:hypothetical protein